MQSIEDEYLELKISCNGDTREILIAWLADYNFNTFEEIDEGLSCYGLVKELDVNNIENFLEGLKEALKFEFVFKKVKNANWNEEWEENYQPIIVEDQCLIHASFHKIDKDYPFKVLINPKMSFGTGHHATTYLMVKEQLALDHKEKIIFDIGTGTGILAILSSKLGAKKTYASEINPWGVQNSKENFSNNNCEHIELFDEELDEITFSEDIDIILANINRNTHLNEMHHYYRMLKLHGLMLLSGFYQEDEYLILKEASKKGFINLKSSHRNNWSCVLFQKN